MDPLFCAKNDDIPWIGSDGITVYEPWMSYPAPEHGCCDVPSQDAYFDAQGRPIHVCEYSQISYARWGNLKQFSYHLYFCSIFGGLYFYAHYVMNDRHSTNTQSYNNNDIESPIGMIGRPTSLFFRTVFSCHLWCLRCC